VSNPRGKFSPTIICTVRVLKQDGLETDADFFLSKEALAILGISKKELSKGIFDVKYHIMDKPN
jgi:hypothetical protein